MNVKKMGAMVATVGLVLGLSGCVRMISDVTLHENNTVSGEIIFAVQEGVGSSMGMTDQAFADQMKADSGTATLANAKVEPYKQDGYIGSRVTFSDEPISSFKGVDGEITRVGDTFVFKGTEPDTTTTQQVPEGSGAIATMSITFPGKVMEHNGTRKGNTVTWDLLTQKDAPYATGSAIGGGGSVNVAIIIGALALVGLVIVGLVILGIVLLTRRKGASPKDAPPPAPTT